MHLLKLDQRTSSSLKIKVIPPLGIPGNPISRSESRVMVLRPQAAESSSLFGSDKLIDHTLNPFSLDFRSPYEDCLRWAGV